MELEFKGGPCDGQLIVLDTDTFPQDSIFKVPQMMKPEYDRIDDIYPSSKVRVLQYRVDYKTGRLAYEGLL